MRTLLAAALLMIISGCVQPSRDQITDKGPVGSQPVTVSQAELLGAQYYARNGNVEVIYWYSSDDRLNSARIAKFVSEGWRTEATYGNGSLNIYMVRIK